MLNEKSKVEKSIYSMLLFISQERIAISTCLFKVKKNNGRISLKLQNIWNHLVYLLCNKNQSSRDSELHERTCLQTLYTCLKWGEYQDKWQLDINQTWTYYVSEINYMLMKKNYRIYKVLLTIFHKLIHYTD